MVGGGGFEPPKLSRQIYSLIPLTAREPLRKRGAIFITWRPPVNTFVSKNTYFNHVSAYPDPISKKGRRQAGAILGQLAQLGNGGTGLILMLQGRKVIA